MEKIGLVMEGGAMRGMFTAAVLDVFMEQGIRLDAAIGVSAGATFGCNYVSGQRGRALRYCIKYRHDPRFCSFPSLLLTGNLFGADFCYHRIPEELDPFDFKSFRASGIPFYIVCTDVERGTPVYHLCKTLKGSELEWLRASASMPLASRIVRIGGKALLDGGISDSIPLEYFEKIGFDRNVVILTQPHGYKKQEISMMPAIRSAYKAYPALIQALQKRHLVYNAELKAVAKAENAGKAFVIRPPQSLPIGHTAHRAEKFRAAYAIGRQTAMGLLPQLRQFLSENR